jgi:hypothetical protein
MCDCIRAGRSRPPGLTSWARVGGQPPEYGSKVDIDAKVATFGRAYELFNERDIDQLLAMMVDDVQWPDVADGVVLEGRTAVRTYWERQFAVTRPRVVPTEFVAVGDDITVVVDQRIFDLDGAPLTDSAVVFHRYSFREERIRRMAVHPHREDAISQAV